MRDLAELNINERGKPVSREAPSPEAVVAFEREFNTTLPADYRAFLRYSNGGHPELDSIAPIGRPGVARRSVDHFYYLNDDRAGNNSLWVAMRTWRVVLGDKAIPFAEDGGGNPFFLDLDTHPPKVRTCLHDENFTVVDIAPSFVEFIDSLVSDPEMI